MGILLRSCRSKKCWNLSEPDSLNLKQRIGLWRSIAMYYWKPFNRKRLLQFYSQFVSPGDLCFDIGSHVGNRTATFSALGANVISVDPQPVCISYLHRRFDRDPNVTIVEKAVSDRPGTLDLHISHTTPTITTASSKAWRDRINDNAWYEVHWEEVRKPTQSHQGESPRQIC